jgi:hypothetical protein
MGGQFDFEVNKTAKRYRVTTDTNDGLAVYSLSYLGEGRWGGTAEIKKRADEAFLLSILPEGHGWTEEKFIVYWAGVAEGIRIGKRSGVGHA